MREKLTAIEGEGAQLLAVDPHEVWSAKFLLKETGLSTDDLNFPLLMDAAHTVSAAYGVAFQMRIHTELSNRPATFLIDREGIIRYARLGTTFSDRPTVEEVLAEIKRLSADQDKPASRAEQLKSLRKMVDDAEAAYLRATEDYASYTTTADEIMPRVVELARKEPHSTDAFEALEWVVVDGRQAAWKEWGLDAVRLLRDHHAGNPKLRRLCAALGYLYWWDDQHEPARDLLRDATTKNPDRTVRALASFSLARQLHKRAKALRRRERATPEPLLDEAEKLFEAVLADHADVREPLPEGRKLADVARAELFEMRHLAIGKVAPEIEGEDVHGTKFKLSDYRGQVVVLDFWGHW